MHRAVRGGACPSFTLKGGPPGHDPFHCGCMLPGD